MRYPFIMSRLVNTPLLAHPAKVATVFNVLAGRLGCMPLGVDDDPHSTRVAELRRRSPDASRFYGKWADAEDGRGVEPFRLTRQGVGIITVTGSLINRGAWIGSASGETSYEGIKHQLARAGDDSRVHSLILDIESPGGEAVGSFEVASAVRSVASKKPVIAVANGMAASAAYALASGATKIITTPTGMAGSIGVVLVHLDYSRYLDEKGVTPTLIFEGAHKTEGNPLEPLSNDATDALRADVRKYYDLFIEAVAAGRGRKTSAKAARDSEGRIFIGRDAVDAKLADDVGTFEEVLSELSRRSARSVSAGAASSTQARARSVAMESLIDENEQRVHQVGQFTLESRDQPLMIGMQQAEYDRNIAQVRREGGAAQIERFKTIAADPRIKGKESFAFNLACEAPDMPAESVGKMCESVPAVDAVPLIPSIAERAAKTGADAISSYPAPEGKSAISAGWDSAIDAVNKRTVASATRQLQRN